ncbi:MAG TPA: T9SS type A sorting domain-containing protein [candidate division Zixibacteria bacterium]|nr:T9SS type A sorting domain-containing protein [candidate division Zixibacteria bacterium]
MDISGRVVKDIRNGEIKVDDLPPGIYLLKLNLGGKIVTKKLLVM